MWLMGHSYQPVIKNYKGIHRNIKKIKLITPEIRTEKYKGVILVITNGPFELHN